MSLKEFSGDVALMAIYAMAIQANKTDIVYLILLLCLWTFYWGMRTFKLQTTDK